MFLSKRHLVWPTSLRTQVKEITRFLLGKQSLSNNLTSRRYINKTLNGIYFFCGSLFFRAIQMIVLSFDFQVWFVMNFFGKQSNLPFFTQELSQGEKHGFLYAWVEYYRQWNTVLWCRAWVVHYLLAVICGSRGGLSANEKKEKFASNDNCHS